MAAPWIRGPVDEPRALAQGPSLAKPLIALRSAALLVALLRGAYIGGVNRSRNIAAATAADGRALKAPPIAHARFSVGELVRHRLFDFRGVVFDVDPVFANSEEWYQSIPEDIRPPKDQPFYHLLAENSESSYVAYVSQQNLLPDDDGEPIDHPAISGIFEGFADGRYRLRRERRH